ncbi:hypothetical protein DRQ36_05900, partial [bacterium]
MRELGEYLKQMRVAKGLSIEDIAEATKISVEYIVALEEGNFDILPAEIYVRGFIKSYGELLGADLDDLFSRYEAAKPKPKARRIFSGAPKEPPPYEPPIKKQKVGKKRVIPRRISITPGRIIGLIVLILIIVVAVKLIMGKKPAAGPPVTNINDVV